MISRDYQFPKITDKLYNEIKEFYNKVCGDDTYAGAIGGDITFHITPTSLGDIFEVEVRDERLVIGDFSQNAERDLIKITRDEEGNWHAEIPDLDL